MGFQDPGRYQDVFTETTVVSGAARSKKKVSTRALTRSSCMITRSTVARRAAAATIPAEFVILDEEDNVFPELSAIGHVSSIEPASNEAIYGHPVDWRSGPTEFGLDTGDENTRRDASASAIGRVCGRGASQRNFVRMCNKMSKSLETRFGYSVSRAAAFKKKMGRGASGVPDHTSSVASEKIAAEEVFPVYSSEERSWRRGLSYPC